MNEKGFEANGNSGWTSAGQIAAALAVSLLTLLLNVRVLTGDEQAVSYHDNLAEAYPLKLEAARQWKEGRVPLWNPYKRVGAPLIADPVAAVFYPGDFPFLLDDGHVRYRALELVAVFHYSLAAFLMYFFLRTIRIATIGSMLGALVYSANGFLVWVTGNWIQMQATAVWLPLILIGLHLAATSPAFWAWSAVGAAAVALQILAGYPQFSFYSGLVAGAYALSLAVAPRSRGWRPVAALAVVFLGGAALAAVQLFPMAELAAISRRSIQASWEHFVAMPAGWTILVGWAVPKIAVDLPLGFPNVGGSYVGAVAVALAIQGALGLDRRRLVFVGVLVTSFMLSLGASCPLSTLAYQIPGLNAFRFPFKHAFEMSFCLSTLAALGAEDLMRRRRGARLVTSAGVIAVSAGGAYLVLAKLRLGGFATIAHGMTPFLLLSTLVLTLCFALLCLADRRMAALTVAIAALWVGYYGNRADILRYSMWGPKGHRGAPPPVVDLLQQPYRVLSLRNLARSSNARDDLLVGDYPTEFRISAVHGTGPFLWKALARAIVMEDAGFLGLPTVLSPRDRMLDVLGCRYILSPRLKNGKAFYQRMLGRYGYRVIANRPGFVLFERPGTLPEVRFVDRVTCGSSTEAIRPSEKRFFNAEEVAVTYCANKPLVPPRLASPGDAGVTVIRREPGLLQLQADLPLDLPGFLVVSQADLPGWHATVDGSEVPIHRTYGVIQGIVVPGGQHRIMLEYLPLSFKLGVAVSLLAAVLLGARALRERRLRGGSEQRGGLR